ncbi:MAG: hypothetical protein ACTMIA_08845 [Vibrio sp.]
MLMLISGLIINAFTLIGLMYTALPSYLTDLLWILWVVSVLGAFIIQTRYSRAGMIMVNAGALSLIPIGAVAIFAAVRLRTQNELDSLAGRRSQKTL